MASFDDVIKLATLATRTVPLCLAGELVDEIAQLELQLAEAVPPTNLGDASPKRLIAERIIALQERMQESTRGFALRAFPSHGPDSWSKFWAKMPTRGEKEPADEWDDRIFPFYAELVSRSCFDPLMTVDQVTLLAESLHNRSWSDLVNGCLNLNMSELDIPNSVAASELTGSSEQT